MSTATLTDQLLIVGGVVLVVIIAIASVIYIAVMWARSVPRHRALKALRNKRQGRHSA